MTDRRHTPRQRTFLGGKIAFDKRSSTMDCLVRNMTDGGARIVFSDSVLLPEQIELTVPHKGLETRCKIVWRKGTEMGVSFSDTVSSKPTADIVPLSYVRRLAECEKEKAALRQRVEQLSLPE